MNNLKETLSNTNDNLTEIRNVLLPLVKEGRLDCWDYLNVIAKIASVEKNTNQWVKPKSIDEVTKDLLDLNEFIHEEVKAVLKEYIDFKFNSIR